MAALPNQPPTEADHPRDNLLGACAALGEITRLDPLVFRIAFILAMLGLSFEWTIGTYLIVALAFLPAQRRVDAPRSSPADRRGFPNHLIRRQKAVNHS